MIKTDKRFTEKRSSTHLGSLGLLSKRVRMLFLDIQFEQSTSENNFPSQIEIFRSIEYQ